jgi:hypothetical protein
MNGPTDRWKDRGTVKLMDRDRKTVRQMEGQRDDQTDGQSDR